MVKRLIGGLVLLNLCTISLVVTAGEVDITNNEVLEQLKELRTFIDEKRNFSKESKQLKPVLVQYRSSASKIDGIVQCNMQFNTDALHLNICGTSIQKDGTPLTITINVVYEYTDYVGYTIKTAKLNATQNQPIFESIVDKNRNKRFIEGSISVDAQTGLTIDYGKWSLCGTHLMCVVAGHVSAGNTAELSLKTTFDDIPDWVIDKIYPLGTGDNVAYSTIYIYNDVTSEVTTENAILIKSTDLGIYHHNAIGDENDLISFRLAFDLLIDDEVIE